MKISAFRGNSPPIPSSARATSTGAPRFIPLGVAVLTVSDSRTKTTDKSGDTLEQFIIKDGHRLIKRLIVKDDPTAITATVKGWLKDEKINVILATGGTGVTARDTTPEVFAALYEKELCGFGELFRQLGYGKIGPAAIQSRASAGVAEGTYLFSLPGSPSACRDAWQGILHSQLDNRTRPCNLASLLPRLQK